MQSISQTQAALLAFLAKALFQKQVNITVTDWKSLYREANTHKVFPCVFEVTKSYVEDEALLEKRNRDSFGHRSGTFRYKRISSSNLGFRTISIK